MHLTFDTSTTSTTAADSIAVTQTTNIYIDPTGFTHYYAIVKFNGWYLRNSTKEYMICSILHEAMHAIFKLRWQQYQHWLNNGVGSIDSFYMKSHFPIYWENFVQNGIPPNNINDHQIMATDYFNFFNSLIAPFYNPFAPQAIRDSVIKAISYSGLLKTTAWKLLPSQGIDTCKYKNILSTAQRSLIGTYNLGGSCTNFTTHYADSLKMRQNCN